jgi:hypothetical protein
MKLDRHQLRRIINEEASMLGISLNEIMGRESFSSPVEFRWREDLQRYESLGAVYTDSGRPIVAAPGNALRLLSMVYPKNAELVFMDGSINKDAIIFKYVTDDGRFLNAKEAAAAMGVNENFTSGLKQIKDAWAMWVDRNDPEVLEHLDEHDRADFTVPGKTMGGSASPAGKSRPPTRQEMLAQMLGQSPVRGAGPAAGPSPSAPRPAAPAAGTAGSLLKGKIDAIIAAADAMMEMLDQDNDDAMMAIEEYLAATETFRNR